MLCRVLQGGIVRKGDAIRREADIRFGLKIFPSVLCGGSDLRRSVGASAGRFLSSFTLSTGSSGHNPLESVLLLKCAIKKWRPG